MREKARENDNGKESRNRKAETSTKKGLTKIGNSIIIKQMNSDLSGCQIVFFTTGRGTPFSTFVPTMKIGTNNNISAYKSNWIDFNANSMDEVGLFDLLQKTINGEYKCKSEDIRGIAFYKTGVTL